MDSNNNTNSNNTTSTVDIAVVITKTEGCLEEALDYFCIRSGEYTTEVTKDTKYLVTDSPELALSLATASDGCASTIKSYLIEWSK